jgi:hypothetical protein
MCSSICSIANASDSHGLFVSRMRWPLCTESSIHFCTFHLHQSRNNMHDERLASHVPRIHSPFVFTEHRLPASARPAPPATPAQRPHGCPRSAPCTRRRAVCARVSGGRPPGARRTCRHASGRMSPFWTTLVSVPSAGMHASVSVPRARAASAASGSSHASSPTAAYVRSSAPPPDERGPHARRSTRRRARASRCPRPRAPRRPRASRLRRSRRARPPAGR